METYIETASGLKYHFLNPQEDEITIEDIAFSLANKCRFSGHTNFFSVAEHCCSVSARLPEELQLAGLLHDAAEAYLGDIPAPLKACLPDYRHLETINEEVINKKFKINLSFNDLHLIKDADLRALYTEAFYLIPSQGTHWSVFNGKNYTVEKMYKPRCLPPAGAYKLFMDFYNYLTKSPIILPDKQIILTGT